MKLDDFIDEWQDVDVEERLQDLVELAEELPPDEEAKA